MTTSTPLNPNNKQPYSTLYHPLRHPKILDMASRTYALIDGTSRRNYYENQGNANLGYWDDPSYYNPPSKLRSNTEAYKDTVLEKNLLEPQKFGTPYLSHDEITRTVSKQFASGLRDLDFVIVFLSG